MQRFFRCRQNHIRIAKINKINTAHNVVVYVKGCTPNKTHDILILKNL